MECKVCCETVADSNGCVVAAGAKWNANQVSRLPMSPPDKGEVLALCLYCLRYRQQKVTASPSTIVPCSVSVAMAGVSPTCMWCYHWQISGSAFGVALVECDSLIIIPCKSKRTLACRFDSGPFHSICFHSIPFHPSHSQTTSLPVWVHSALLGSGSSFCYRRSDRSLQRIVIERVSASQPVYSARKCRTHSLTLPPLWSVVRGW